MTTPAKVKPEQYSAATISTFLIGLVAATDFGGEYEEHIMTGIPIAIAGIAIAWDWFRLGKGWSSYSELKEDKNLERHLSSIRRQIADCERALDNPNLEKHHAEYKTRLHKLTKSLFRDVTVTGTEETPQIQTKPD